jgi:hypothetical protein
LPLFTGVRGIGILRSSRPTPSGSIMLMYEIVPAR